MSVSRPSRAARLEAILGLHHELYRLCLTTGGPRTFEIDVSKSQLKALLAIASLTDGATEPTAGALAAALRVTPSTVSTLIDRLLARELIELRSDPQDRRQHRLRLSKAGITVLSQFHDEMQVQLSALLDVLSDEELDVVLKSEEILIRAARQVAGIPEAVAVGDMQRGSSAIEPAPDTTKHDVAI